jgi:hypothetical protein
MSKSVAPPQQQHAFEERDSLNTTQKPATQMLPSPQHSPGRSHLSKLTHALPPKPVVTSVPFVHPFHSHIIEARAMSRNTGRAEWEKKTNGNISNDSHNDDVDKLPPDWEVRHPRSGGRGIYYYNVKTHKSTWTFPANTLASSPTQEKESDKTTPAESANRDKLQFEGATAAERTPTSRSSRFDPPLQAAPIALSYEDRHYRPSDSNVQREERGRAVSAPPSPKEQFARPRSPVERARDQIRPPRRPSLPRMSSGDRAVIDSQREESRTTNSTAASDRHSRPSRVVAPADAPSRRRSSPALASQVADVEMSSYASSIGARQSGRETDWAPAPSTFFASSPLPTSSLALCLLPRWRVRRYREASGVELCCGVPFPGLFLDSRTLTMDPSVLPPILNTFPFHFLQLF